MNEHLLISDKKPDIQKALAVLNEAFQADSSAVWTLCNTYTRCNETLAEHPHVQVVQRQIEGAATYSLSVLGVLNGVLDALFGTKICILTSEPNEEGKRTLLGFDIYSEAKYPPA